MKTKLAILAFLFTLLGAVTLSQVVAAQTKNQVNPITPPITVPILYPVSGNVTYRFINFLPEFFKEILPAAGVIIEAINIETDEVTSVKTDNDGNFQLDLASGVYVITASDQDGTFFSPPEYEIEVSDKVSGIDFEGLIFIDSPS